MKNRLFLIVIFLALQTGCSGEIIKTVPEQQAKQVISALMQARERIHAIHIRMRAAVYSHGKARKGRMEVFARGGNLRAEIWSPTDNLLDLTVVCNDHFIHLIPDKSICETGPVSILDFLPIALPYPNIPTFFAGLGPDPKNAMVFHVSDSFLLKFPREQGHNNMKVALNPLRVFSYELSVSNKRYEVTQRRFKPAKDLLIPRWIRAETGDKLIQLKYKTINVNPDLSADIFKCTCPENFQVRRQK